MWVYVTGGHGTNDQCRRLADHLRGVGCVVWDAAFATEGSALPLTEFIPFTPPEPTEETALAAPLSYFDYLDDWEWHATVERIRKSIVSCDACVCVLPLDQESSIQFGFAVALGKIVVLCGSTPHEQTPLHLWATAFCDDFMEVSNVLDDIVAQRALVAYLQGRRS